MNTGLESWSCNLIDGGLRVDCRRSLHSFDCRYCRRSILFDLPRRGVVGPVFLTGENLASVVVSIQPSYYENPAEAGRYAHLQSISYADGSWEKYDYDADGNRVLVMRPWKDLALASATEANSRSTRYKFSNFDGVTALCIRHLNDRLGSGGVFPDDQNIVSHKAGCL